MSVKAPPVGEEDLMVRIGAGDVQAFEVFFDRYSGLAFSLAMRTLDDRVLAADATQEAFLSIWRHGASYRPEKGSPRSWLLGIVRHRAIDTWRRERTHQTDLHDERLVEQQSAPDCTEEQIITHAIACDERECIHAGLKELPLEQRRVIELAYFAGLSQTEISAQLGLALGTTKSRMRLALSKLRVAMTDADRLADSSASQRAPEQHLTKLAS